MDPIVLSVANAKQSPGDQLRPSTPSPGQEASRTCLDELGAAARAPSAAQRASVSTVSSSANTRGGQPARLAPLADKNW